MSGLKDKKIAVVGVSSDENKNGYKIFRDLVSAGYDVYGVNPRSGEIMGRKIYRSLKEIEIVPDVVVTVVPPEITEKIVEECKETGISEIWMQPGSESETAVTKARNYGMKVTFNACLMVENGLW